MLLALGRNEDVIGPPGFPNDPVFDPNAHCLAAQLANSISAFLTARVMRSSYNASPLRQIRRVSEVVHVL
jgi:hypothetical protein